MRLRSAYVFATTTLTALALSVPAWADSPMGGIAAPSAGAGGTQTSAGAGGTQTSAGAGGTQTSAGAGGTQTSGGGAGLTPTTSISPVTGRRPHASSVYTGPVYELTSAGQIVPYEPTSTRSDPTVGATLGASSGLPRLLVPGTLAATVNGLGAAPENAPAAVQNAIWAANAIIGRPYEWAGGHTSFRSHGYDCSGTVSYALHGAGLLRSPLDSSSFMSWGAHGLGQWITVFTNPGHAYVDIAGIRLDTSAADDPSQQQGPRWRPLRPANSGFTARHPDHL